FLDECEVEPLEPILAFGLSPNNLSVQINYVQMVQSTRKLEHQTTWKVVYASNDPRSRRPPFHQLSKTERLLYHQGEFARVIDQIEKR
ncbi:10272_t:CDS:2, partial [Ambispora leptoticha]